MSVCFQLLSPASKGLYARAIDQSGPCATVGLFKDRQTADQTGINFAKSLGCPPDGTNALNCLKKLPAETLASASPGAASLGGITSWVPTYGTKIVPQDGRAFAAGDFNRVPFINGSNRDEGRLFALFALPRLQNNQDYEKNLRVQFGAKADKVLGAYPAGDYGSPALAYAAVVTDRLFACPALGANEAMSRHTPVYAYEFSDRRTPYALAVPKEIQSLGAYHAGEIPYIFQTRTAPFTDPASFTIITNALYGRRYNRTVTKDIRLIEHLGYALVVGGGHTMR